MKTGQPFTNTVPHKLAPVEQADYVIAVVLNKESLALVFESPRTNLAGVHWQVLTHHLPSSTDPFTAVQTALLQKTGHQTSNWSYLGSHVMTLEQPSGSGYFFCARQAHPVAAPKPNGHSSAVARWVPLTDLRYALLDGRIATTSHALTVSLTLLTLHE